jgi:hypothetical protein
MVAASDLIPLVVPRFVIRGGLGELAPDVYLVAVF